MTEAGKGRRGCLLVVDDDSTIRLLLQAALQKDYDMLCVPNGPKTAGFVENSRPGLILLDIDIPGSPSYTLCEEIRRQAALWKVPILFMTVRQTNPGFFADLESSGNSYIKKPFEIPALKRRIERMWPLPP